MRYVLTNAQMREADKFTIETLEVPSLLLMERAGAALAEEAERLCPEGGILCVCGGGNNGGDGFVCARILLQKGLSVEALCVADKFSADCKKNRDEFEKLGGEVYSVFPRKRFALIVDCLFGTGFSGELEGKNAFAADFINSSGAKVLSADIPSGVSGNNGLAAKNAVRADETLCIGEYKAGVFLGDGIDLAGKIARADIGIALPALSETQNGYAFLTGKKETAELLPPKKRNSHKGSYGRAAIVAGSAKYTGAAYLSAAAALRSGAGYTTLCVPENLLPLYALKLPEVLLEPMEGGDRVAFTEEGFKKLLTYDSIAFGMGTGVSEDIFKGAAYLLCNYKGRLILDADALNSLAKYGGKETESIFADKKCDVLLTPHLKEFSRLTGESTDDLLTKGLNAPKDFAKKRGVTVLLKGAATVISDGKRTALNVAGTAGQAKGGSGDVLSGLIAGLCAGGLSAFDGACAGAYLAGKAAEFAAAETGEYSLTASDEIAYLGRAFRALRE